MELIDRRPLIEKLKNAIALGHKIETFVGELEAVLEDVENMPTIEAPEWIPCSERLPTEEEQDINLGVLVTLGNGYKGMDFDWYHDGRWYDWGDRVIAWMLLPKPYGERKESEK